MSAQSPRFIALDRNAKPLTEGNAHAITRDTLTGLEWAGAACSRVTHADAIKTAKALDLAGGKWRLPTRAEMIDIADITRHSPACDADAFPFIQSSWYWSTDKAAWSSASAWLVDFGHGLVLNFHRDNDGFALAVRRAGQ